MTPSPPDSHPGRRLLTGWVRLVQGAPRTALALALLLTVGAAQFTIAHIGINTNTTDMLSEDLPFRQYDRALSQAFPQFSDNLIAVVEAVTPDLADDGARRLAAALATRPELFDEVFYPDGDPFFRRNGLLYLDTDELTALGDRLAEIQPLLAALAADPSLRGLAGVLRQALEEGGPGGAAGGAAGGATGGTEALDRALDAFSETAEALAIERNGGGAAPPLSWQTLLSGEAAAPADKRRFIVVRPVLDYTSLEPAAAAIAGVRALAVEHGLTAAQGLRVRLTGGAVMFQDELHSLRDGMGLVGLISAILVIGLLALGLRSLRLVAATLAALIAGLIWTAGFATLAIGELNLISVAFAVLFIGLSVDFGIHFALRYREAVEAGSGEDRDDSPGNNALVEAARGVGGALTLCAVAAAIGFFSFLPTAYRGVSELGLIAGAGMFIALFANLTVLPAILSLAPLKPRGRVLRSPLGDRLQRLAGAHPRRVIVGALALGLGAAALLPFARFDDDPLNLRDPAAESVATLFELFDDPRVTPYSATVLAPSLDAGVDLALRLAALPEVDSTRTIADLVPPDQDDKLAIVDEMAVFLGPLFPGPLTQDVAVRPAPDPDENQEALDGLREALESNINARALPAARRLADALDGLAEAGGSWSSTMLVRLEGLWLAGLPGRLEALGTALEAEGVTLKNLPADLRARYLAADGRARVEVLPAEDLRVPAARARFVDAVRSIAPEVTGAPVTLTEAGRAVIQAFGEAAAYALILIAVLLLVLLRSARDSLMVLAPLTLAALLTAGATVVLDIPFNFANVIVLPLLFGLGVASGIHMVIRARGSGPGGATGGATGGAAGLLATSTPRAVLFSALTTIGSFGALALSSHRGTASMGILLTIAISLTMLCTLIVLPALLTRSVRPPDAPARRWPAPMRLLTLIAGIALLAYVASRIDLAAVWARVLELGPLGALAAAAIYFLAFLIDTASWQLALPSVRLNGAWLYRLWKVRMVGEALNLVIPAGSMGGEPVKAVLLKRSFGIGYRESAASLFIARTVNLLSLVAFAAVGFVLMLGVEALPRPFVLTAGLGLAALGLGVVGFYAVQRWGAASFLARRLVAWRSGGRSGGRLAGRLAGALEGFLEHIHAVDDRFEQFYVRQRLRFAAALALALLNWLAGVAEIAAIMWFLGAPVSLSEAWLIEAVAQLVRAGFFFVPASLGVTEAAMVLVYDALTGRPSLGFAVALIRRARELVWIAWGLWLGWLEAPGALTASPETSPESGDPEATIDPAEGS